MPVSTMASPAASAAAITSSSRSEPPGWITAVAPASAAAIVVGWFFTSLPHSFEWVELAFGIPLILGAFGLVLWTRGFTHEDRVLFRMKGGEKAALPSGAPLPRDL